MMDAATLRAVTGCTQAAADLYARPLADACAYYGIDATPQRLSMFLAQLAHESGSLRYVRELWGPTAQQLRYEPPSTLAAKLGNTQPGDGSRYRGRGLIQITGRHNYAQARDRLRAEFGPDDVPDFEADPDALEQPRWACLTAAEFWARTGCNELADTGDYVAVTKRINGGTTGLHDRLARLGRARAALSVNDPPSVAPPLSAHGSTQQTRSTTMAPFLAAALPALIDAIPKLGRLFSSGSPTAERNVAAAETVARIVQDATNTPNIQAAVETIKADPTARQAAEAAVEARWYELVEAGGGGIDGARKADAQRSDNADKIRDVWKSHSFWIALTLIPLVYVVVLSVIGVIGSATWSDDVRASIAGMIVGTIIGGLMGYYFGQTTSRNRGPAP